MPRFVMFDELFETFGKPADEPGPAEETGCMGDDFGDDDDGCDCDCCDFEVELRILDAVTSVAVDVDELVSGYIRLAAAVFGETCH